MATLFSASEMALAQIVLAVSCHRINYIIDVNIFGMWFDDSNFIDKAFSSINKGILKVFVYLLYILDCLVGGNIILATLFSASEMAWARVVLAVSCHRINYIIDV